MSRFYDHYVQLLNELIFWHFLHHTALADMLAEKEANYIEKIILFCNKHGCNAMSHLFELHARQTQRLERAELGLTTSVVNTDTDDINMSLKFKAVKCN